MSVDPITCHILDTTLGKPAQNVTCSIFYLSPLITNKNDEAAYDLDPAVQPFAMSRTDNDGRIKKWVVNPGNGDGVNSKVGVENDEWSVLKPGVYKIKFLTGKYFHDIDASSRTFFPFVDITFQIDSPPDHHYHVPLLLSNHSYSTYRGS
ncbi:Hydroxyisourate hydrolase [Metschnikowia bicuspidata var. bicuspidata NRRL YB-4993]|uniref:5-hydroxyisourate hydrolase n=1 Tax=Metschnikowia bicuspidata var. bicuspidata NRRL YB-4993 TaxID=869754 RepID=A0A1A0HA95_9ASCO|nr:Hydroxyisourate hydrolase [Metschnikowia bicuspidata var. bicuspidata NRRL YB-4993]OBA20925.1 Hydroxyisourate hydrolase [Metschnikowia bicuspidata var. bicuspidata NRRL YB-4993]